jgi:PASTA domain
VPFVPGFKPSLNAPVFLNGPWPSGADLQVSIMGLPPVNIDSTHFGLCGGMSFLTRDIFEAGTPQLQSPMADMLPVPLVQHIQRRLIDSFQPVPAIPMAWVSFDEAEFSDSPFFGQGTFGRSVLQAPGIKDEIVHGRLCPIGVLRVNHSYAPWDVFANHVELVWGWEQDGMGVLTLHVYDCNMGARDDITITIDISAPSPPKTIATNGTFGASGQGTIQGFFQLPYTHVDPAPAYIDDAVVSVSSPPPAQMKPGETANVAMQAANVGSTTWTPDQQYRLGSQSPQDNSSWGTNRIPLTAPVPPQSSATFPLAASAPQAAGAVDFAWGMVRESVHWFGSTSPVIKVRVGAAPPPPPPHGPVPNVVGDFAAAARSAIQSAGYSPLVKSVPDLTCNKIGVVISQSPRGGTVAASGSTVTISVGQQPPNPCP